MSLWNVGSQFLRSALTSKTRLSRKLAALSLQPERAPQEVDTDEIPPPPSIAKVDKVTENTLCVTFSDDSKCHFNTFWLRDSCRCPRCIHPLTHGRKIDCSKINPSIKPTEWSLKESGQLEIVWPTENEAAKSIQPHVTTFTAEWLYQFIPVFEKRTSTSNESVPPPEIDDVVYTQHTSVILWNRNEFEEELPEVTYNDFMHERTALKKTLKHVCKYGISIIRGVPMHEEEVAKVARRIGYIKEIGCGQTFQLRPAKSHSVDDQTSSAAQTSKNINNQVYKEWSSGVELLHCTGAPGGVSESESSGSGTEGTMTFVDGFSAAQWLRFNHPDAFRILTATPVTFSFHDAERDRWYRDSMPVIRLDSRGKVKEIHYSVLYMRPPLLPSAEVEAFYGAFRLLSKKLEDKEMLFEVNLRPGDLVIFNNRRVIERQTGASSHQFNGCYVDFDEIHALYEKMRKEDLA